MILDSTVTGIFPYIKLLHNWIVMPTTVLIAIWLFTRSIYRIIKQKPYIKLDKQLAYGFIITLYLQFTFGIVLFSNLFSGMGYNYMSADNSMKIVSKRLWPVEHIVLMIFALVIANLGLFISLKTKSDKGKYKNILVYYSFSLLLIIFTLFAINFL